MSIEINSISAAKGGYLARVGTAETMVSAAPMGVRLTPETPVGLNISWTLPYDEATEVAEAILAAVEHRRTQAEVVGSLVSLSCGASA